MMFTLWGFIAEKETFLILYYLYSSTLFLDFAKAKWECSRIFIALTKHLNFSILVNSGHIFKCPLIIKERLHLLQSLYAAYKIHTNDVYQHSLIWKRISKLAFWSIFLSPCLGCHTSAHDGWKESQGQVIVLACVLSFSKEVWKYYPAWLVLWQGRE